MASDIFKHIEHDPSARILCNIEVVLQIFKNSSHDPSSHFPRLADGLDPSVALGDYFETYVQRDLRELVQLRHLAEFERFVRLAAGRIGQVLYLQGLAADLGISGHTAREWITLLEVLKTYANAGERPHLHFFRDSAGNEADLVLEQGHQLMLLEIKSARTVASDAMRSIASIRRSIGERVAWSALIYDGDEAQRRSDFDVVPCWMLQRWLTGA